MHAERLRAVADLIEEQGDEHFDLEQWFAPGGRFCPNLPIEGIHAILDPDQECGTTACVAGWAATIMLDEGIDITRNWVDFPRQVANWLGLTVYQGNNLFLEDQRTSIWRRIRDDYGWELKPGDMIFRRFAISAADAADVLRKIADGVYEL